MKTNFEDYVTELAPTLAASEKASVFLLRDANALLAAQDREA